MTAETETAVAVSGEVVISDESTADAKLQVLRDNEKIVKKNWKAATEKAQIVYKALTVIHTFDLWKMHKDEKGKRKYSSFEKYLFGEFGWELSRVRALQVIKQTREAMIETGELPASAAEPRTRTAPEVTSERAARVTADQLQRVLDAFITRVDSIDSGDTDLPTMVRILNDVRDAVTPAIVDLREIVFAADADAEDTDEDTDEDEDEDEDESEA